MNPLIQSAIFGAIGGITRAFVGLLKYYRVQPKKKGKFSFSEFSFTIIASAIIGLFMGLLIATNFALSLLAGYAGTDLIESIYKIYKVKAKQKFKI